MRRAQVSYKDEDYYGDLGVATRPVRVPRKLDEEEVEALREKNGKALPGEGEAPGSAAKKRGPQDSGKGVRIQVRDDGGRPRTGGVCSCVQDGARQIFLVVCPSLVNTVLRQGFAGTVEQLCCAM